MNNMQTVIDHPGNNTVLNSRVCSFKQNRLICVNVVIILSCTTSVL